jgi:hypothetical protein
VIAIRWISSDLTIQQRLIHLGFCAASFHRGDVVHHQSNTVGTLSDTFPKVKGFPRDRASVNESALQLLKILYKDAIDVKCLSHTVDHSGENFTSSPRALSQPLELCFP